MAAEIAFTGLLQAAPPQVSCADAQSILLHHYGMAATAALLSSERDCNFRMTLASGGSLLLKVTNSAEDPAVTRLQTHALQFLESGWPQLPVPRLVPARDGKAEVSLNIAGDARHVVRLMSFLPGEPASARPKSGVLRREIFRSLAELDKGLSEFGHVPGADRQLLWDVSQAGRLRPLTESITESEVRAAALGVLDRYEREIAPQLTGLRSQVIHNDFNPNNVLLSADEPRVSGIIDFGDLIHAPLIGDLATGAAYQMIGVSDSLEALCECTSAFHQRFPLAPEELEVLFDLALARLVLIVSITEWRARNHPANRAYILRNTSGAASMLKSLAATSPTQVKRLLRQACRM